MVLCYEIGSFRVKNDTIPDKLWAIFNPVHPPYLLRESFYDHRDCSGSINHPLVIPTLLKTIPANQLFLKEKVCITISALIVISINQNNQNLVTIIIIINRINNQTSTVNGYRLGIQ